LISLQEAVQLINQMGFPIAAFLLMFYQNTVVIKANTMALQEIKEILERGKE
jgi:hypothetical protein